MLFSIALLPLLVNLCSGRSVALEPADILFLLDDNDGRDEVWQGLRKKAKAAKTSPTSTAADLSDTSTNSIVLCEGFVCDDGYNLRTNPDTSRGAVDHATCCMQDELPATPLFSTTTNADGNEETKTTTLVFKWSRELKQNAKSIKVKSALFTSRVSSKSSKSSKSRKGNSSPVASPAVPEDLCEDFICDDGYSLRSNPDTSGGIADRATCCIRDGVCAGAEVGSQCTLGDIDSSLIPNPSFEDRDGCPTGISELSVADIWAQATGGTSDYYVEGPDCDDSWWRNGYVTGSDVVYYGPNPRGASDGVAFVGGGKRADGTSYEYVGACLTSPLQAGIQFTFTLDIAAAPSGYEIGGDTSGSTELLCIPSCDFPISGIGYKGDDYKILATAAPDGGLIGGADGWKSLTFVTTPTEDDCPAIMFGPGADMTVEAGYDGAYVYYDALNLQAGEPGVCNAAGECIAQS